MEPDLIPEQQFGCPACDHAAEAEFKFCPKCGAKRVVEVVERNPFDNKNLVSLLAYFFISLVVLLAYKFTDDYFIGLFEDMVIVTSLLAIIDVGFAIYNGRDSFLFGTVNLKVKPLSLVLIVLVVFAFFVNFLADFLNRNLSDTYYWDEFAATYPLLLVVGFQCLYPAIFEELAFRGFMIKNIQSLSNDRTAIGVSAFMFGITHLSFISLIWLIPLGLLFGYLRIRYNTLWYGVIGHFVYNLVITLIDRGVI